MDLVWGVYRLQLDFSWLLFCVLIFMFCFRILLICLIQAELVCCSWAKEGKNCILRNFIFYFFGDVLSSALQHLDPRTETHMLASLYQTADEANPTAIPRTNSDKVSFLDVWSRAANSTLILQWTSVMVGGSLADTHLCQRQLRAQGDRHRETCSPTRTDGEQILNG